MTHQQEIAQSAEADVFYHLCGVRYNVVTHPKQEPQYYEEGNDDKNAISRCRFCHLPFEDTFLFTMHPHDKLHFLTEQVKDVVQAFIETDFSQKHTDTYDTLYARFMDAQIYIDLVDNHFARLRQATVAALAQRGRDMMQESKGAASHEQ